MGNQTSNYSLILFLHVFISWSHVLFFEIIIHYHVDNDINKYRHLLEFGAITLMFGIWIFRSGQPECDDHVVMTSTFFA